MSAPRPGKVRIGYLTYRIVWMPENEWVLDGERDNACIGEHQGPMASIFIRLIPNVVEQYYRETLLHEMLHGVWFTTDLCESVPPGDEPEEQYVARMTPMLLQVLQDNPDVIAYLIGVEDE